VSLEEAQATLAALVVMRASARATARLPWLSHGLQQEKLGCLREAEDVGALLL
jgi:hypothetical protein